MGQDDRQRKGARPPSRPLELVDIDGNWDDEPTLDDSARLPRLHPEAQNTRVSQRVTSVPDVSPETFAARVLAQSSSESPEASDELRHLESGLHERQTPLLGLEPPPASGVPSEPPVASPGLPFSDDLPPSLGFGASISPTGPTIPAEPPADTPTIEIDELSLKQPAAVRRTNPAVSNMKDRYATGDFTGALEIAESMLQSDPEDLEAKRYAESCREVLTQMYASRLGPLDQVVSMAIPAEQVRWLNLDHRAGFLLSLVDGASSVEELLDISGMPRLDALRTLLTLLERRVIAVESR